MMNVNLKHIAVALVCAMVALPLSAQQEEKSSFTPPKAGDFSIGIDAMPFVNFMGNMFNGTENQTLGTIGGSAISTGEELITPTVSLLGRYMLTDNIAVRVNVGLVAYNSYDAAYAIDDLGLALDGFSEAEVIDECNSVLSGGSFAAGLEYRMGKGRLQGVFSGSVLYMYSTQTTSYSYGNAITELNQNPSNAGLDTSYKPTVSYLTGMRTLKDGGGVTNTLGVVASAGIEWFFVDYMSLGAEVNFAVAYAMTSQTYGEYEGFNANTVMVESYTNTVSPASSKLYLGTDNLGANLTLNFYF